MSRQGRGLQRCRSCWWRFADERHHFLVHARWRSGWKWRRLTPTVPLCEGCHRRITRWDAKPWTPLWLTTLVGMIFGTIRTVLVAGVLVALGILALRMR